MIINIGIVVVFKTQSLSYSITQNQTVYSLLVVSSDFSIIMNKALFLEDVEELHVHDVAIEGSEFDIVDCTGSQTIQSSEILDNVGIVEQIFQELLSSYEMERLVESEFGYIQIVLNTPLEEFILALFRFEIGELLWVSDIHVSEFKTLWLFILLSNFFSFGLLPHFFLSSNNVC